MLRESFVALLKFTVFQISNEKKQSKDTHEQKRIQRRHQNYSPGRFA